jgi:hypothetical protein
MGGDLPSRLPWPDNFPQVVVSSSLASRDGHPLYVPAKSGSADAALALAKDLITPAAINSLKKIIAGKPALILPVVADETMGFNAIPDGMAHVLGSTLKLDIVVGDIVQSNKVGHTRARAFQRIVTPAEFKGEVIEGANYVVLDDHVGLGGTLANLKGYVETRGGVILCMGTLTQSRDAQQISLTQMTRTELWSKHGQALDILWQTVFWHGIDSLTELEALILCRQPSVIDIENFLAQAAIEARSRGLDTGIENVSQ